MKLEQKKRKNLVFKPSHELPGDLKSDYIILPYGEFYQKSSKMMQAKRGDTIRFFNGPERKIVGVFRVTQPDVCDALCRVRYGISWQVALAKWQRYAEMEGNGKGIISPNECLMVVFENEDENI